MSPDGDFHVPVDATDDLAVIADADVVFLSVKAYSVPAIAPQLAPLLPPNAPVVTAQNGIPWWYLQSHPGPFEGKILQSVDPDGVVSRAIHPDHVVGCVLYCSTEIVAPATVRHVEGRRFTIGSPSGVIDERCRQIARAFVEAGLKCSAVPDIRTQIWVKLVGNVAFNPVSALTGATLGELGTSPRMRTVLRSMMEEAAEVASALGIALPISIQRRLEGGLAVGEHKTSMLQDLERGKPLEIDCLTGATIELADMVGVPVPHIRAVHACVELLSETRAGRAIDLRDTKPAPHAQ